MSIFKPSRIQWITAAFPLPLVVVLFLYLLIDFSMMSSSDIVMLTLLFIPISFSSWYTCVLINNIITAKLPGQLNTVKRGIVLFSLHMAWLIVLVLIVFNGLAKVPFLKITFVQDNLISAVLLGAVFNIIFCIIWQVEYIFKCWRKTLAEKEWMEQQLLQQEFDRLKQQLNPHFLFNNLNILSSLISEDPQNASYYLDKLSAVYRYLLKRGKDDMATLEEELAFIHSYVALIEIRYGNSVQIRINPGNDCRTYLLPVLSLQLLVENAIKHNTVDNKRPLIITINVIEDNYIEVKNNLQRKPAISSNKIGLANIQAKYRMLNIENMVINQDGKYFTVKLPLIKTNVNNLSAHEHTNY